jgi:hypothetical protein
MPTPAADPVSDVLMLMLIRDMPEPDFHRLCSQALQGGLNTETEAYSVATLFDSMRQHATACDNQCECCGDVFEDDGLTQRFTAATAQRVCKPCIDTTLGLIFGPPSEDGDIARRAISTMVATKALRSAVGHA